MCVSVCVRVFMENRSDLSPHLLEITENTAQAKTENRDQDTPSTTQNSQDISCNDFKLH